MSSGLLVTEAHTLDVLDHVLKCNLSELPEEVDAGVGIVPLIACVLQEHCAHSSLKFIGRWA